ncbi:MAG: M91 family zinc metallopeptidase [Endozoicomonas sp.]|uniref:M91 family zinc metallopeptidase n=1 Tax=Endozoicomonas sp. TaxID=1892382 RepID=UPI003D9B8B8C
MPAKYWNPTLHAADAEGFLPLGNSNGIGIAESPMGNNQIADFQSRVAQDLASINALPTGQNLITAILQGVGNGKRLGIVAPRQWHAGWGSNECACLGGDNARVRSAVAVGSGDTNTLVNALKIKITSMGHQNDYGWLKDQLRAVPRFRLRGLVANAPNNMGVLDLDIERWLTYQRPLYHGLANGDKNDMKNAIMVFLATHGGMPVVNGPGTNSRVYYDPRKNFNAVGIRPAYVGLSHELIHHYYNMRGAQISHSEDSAHFSTVLYEYMCVGLGPWNGAAISENQIRQDAGVALRTRYA